ncbi:MAG: DUF5681 domain-containing protein [Bryobacteraceae bacterium]
MPFKKGQSGNPGGQPKNRVWRDAIERAINRRAGKLDLQGIDDLADKLLDTAFAGDMMAMKEFGDRIEGKAIQAIEHSGSIARTHEEELINLDNPEPDDTDREGNTPPVAE